MIWLIPPYTSILFMLCGCAQIMSVEKAYHEPLGGREHPCCFLRHAISMAYCLMCRGDVETKDVNATVITI